MGIPERMLVREIIFFPNGNTGVFDFKGKQLSEFQEPWVGKFLDWIEDQTEIDREYLKVHLPHGKMAKFFKTDDGGWNWEVV